MPRKIWTRPELLQVLALYFTTRFGRLHQRNPDIVKLAARIGRTPSAVALKAVNLASCDPRLTAVGIRGMRNSSKADRLLFAESLENPEGHLTELAGLVPDTNLPWAEPPEVKDDFPLGRNVKGESTSRRGHSFFKSAVYANYDGRCAMTGLPVSSLITASHIIPWKIDEKLRSDPRNGLLLSALHDRAFDRGLITVDDDLRVSVSRSLAKVENNPFCSAALLRLQGQPLMLPKQVKFLPLAEALEYHRNLIFKN